MVVVNAKLLRLTVRTDTSLRQIAYRTQAMLQFEHRLVRIVRGVF